MKEEKAMWLSVKRGKNSKFQDSEADVCLTLLLVHEHVLGLKHSKEEERVADSGVEEGQCQVP